MKGVGQAGVKVKRCYRLELQKTFQNEISSGFQGNYLSTLPSFYKVTDNLIDQITCSRPYRTLYPVSSCNFSPMRVKKLLCHFAIIPFFRHQQCLDGYL